jgi:hypothetical protein
MQPITDRDLLILEPGIFTAALAAATVLHSAADGIVADTSLSSAASDFTALDIGESHVVVIDGKPTEVLARIGSTQLTVSLPRADADQAAINPGDGTALAISVPTFARLIQRVQQRILSAIGVDAAASLADPDEPAILNEEEVQRVIGLECIAEAFAIASASDPESLGLIARAQLYARRAASERQRLVASLDLDHDGDADAARRPAVIILRRV